MTESEKKSSDLASRYMLDKAKALGLETIWDHYEAMLPQCGFGELGVCCRMCLEGPCRIDPFGEGAKVGVCGATADAIVARNLDRAIAAGTASHSDHARHVALTLLAVAEGKAPDYKITDVGKLKQVASRIGIKLDKKDNLTLAKEVALAALEDFSRQDVNIPLTWVATTMTPGRIEVFSKLGIVPHNIDANVSEIMHRTSRGNDADPVNLLLGGIKCALCDYAGCHIATDLCDILFGTPKPVVSQANLGILKKDAVNIAVHGHNPLLSDIVVDVAGQLRDEAIKAGAKEGINMVGICCTGNEVLMRKGVGMATHSVSQELVVMTGALDAIVVDIQCIMPSLSSLCDCFHTKLITTMPIAKIPGATHIEFHDDKAVESAKKIIRLAIEAYKHRDPKKVDIPDVKQTAMAGFSLEAIVEALSKVDAKDPLKPLIDNIVNGNIQGIALFAGCNNVKIVQDQNYLAMVKELAKNNVLILATGCGAGAFGRHGFLTSEATEEYAGPGLKAVLTAIGQAVGLNAPLPLVLHMGSCVDNTRAADAAVAVANKLGVDISQLPVVASAPEAMAEKAIAIGTWAVAAGLPTHVGVVPPVLGGPLVTEVLTKTAKDLLGGYFIVETDPVAAAGKLLDAIRERRKGLGI
ncbi:MAG: carbon-monoxide dehydrogenase catalytic subunit [Nitrospinae bacterium RIFCSPLOWO2_12_FULL_45_22]|nr:MAG: carbon-monoxide dehydrogenase catalytic subunit [Nitrospinae bacterium RIFCSPLOWO2_12_FULL_45_22]